MGLMSVMADIWRSRSRSALTMSAVAIGIFSVTVISAAGQIGTAKINDSLDDMGVNSVLVEAQEAGVALSDSDIDALGGLSGVNGAMPLMAQVTKCELIESNVSCMVWGVNEKADEIISMKAIHGRLIDRSDLKKAENICVIDDEIALETYGRTNIVGKTVSVNFGGKYTDFTVIGVAESGLSPIQNMMNDAVPYFVYIPYTTAQNISGKSEYDKIAVLLDKNGDGETAIDRIKTAATSALSFTAGISLAVASVSVMTAMLVSVGERKREIGIKKSLGARNIRIVGEFLAESTMICIIGSIVGIAAGCAAAFVIGLAVGESFVMQTDIMLIAVAVSAVIGMISGSYPAYKAARMKPVDALKM
ncbi:MAG: ABC transporter permease [[Eubacterium] siraeum]|nr:ABC transporter permease [[Eubacterium] siraeum]